MNLTWTNADRKRANAMGFNIYNKYLPRIERVAYPKVFNSNIDAVNWVGNKASFGLEIPVLKTLPKHKADSWRNALTCRKAILLCATAGLNEFHHLDNL